MEIENEIIYVLSEIGIKIEKLEDAKGLFIEREQLDRKSTRLNSSHMSESRMPSSA